MRARMLYTSLIGEQHTSLKLSRKRRLEWALSNLERLLVAEAHRGNPNPRGAESH